MHINSKETDKFKYIIDNVYIKLKIKKKSNLFLN